MNAFFLRLSLVLIVMGSYITTSTVASTEQNLDRSISCAELESILEKVERDLELAHEIDRYDVAEIIVILEEKKAALLSQLKQIGGETYTPKNKQCTLLRDIFITIPVSVLIGAAGAGVFVLAEKMLGEYYGCHQ